MTVVETDRLVGSVTPRLGTSPGRPLTPETSLGFEVAAFARDILGEPLLPWQEEAGVRALEVKDDGTFRFRTVLILVARQSGKTHLLRTVALWRLFVDQANLILSVAQSLDIAREAWRAGCQAVEADPDLKAELARISRVNGDEFLALSNGARWKIGAANRSAGRGLSVDMLVMDELREQRSWDAWSALSKTTTARRRGQTWCISNAGDDQSVVLNHLRESALNGDDDTICLLEWSAEDGCALDDPVAWAQANPGLGHTVSEVAIRSALATDPEPVFRTEVLCQHVKKLVPGALPQGAWKAAEDHGSAPAGAVAFGVEVSLDRRTTTIGAAGLRPDGWWHVEDIEQLAGTSSAPARIAELSRRWAAPVGIDPSSPAGSLIEPLRELGVLVVTPTARQIAAICGQMFDDVTAKPPRMFHRGRPALNDAVTAAIQKPAGDAFRWDRKGEGDIAPLYAVTLARCAHQESPPGMPGVFDL